LQIFKAQSGYRVVIVAIPYPTLELLNHTTR